MSSGPPYPGRTRVENVLFQYALAIDSADRDLLADCFTEDAVMWMEIVPLGLKMERRGRDAIVGAFATGFTPERPRRRHVMTNLALEAQPDGSVRAMSYLTVLTISDLSVEPMTVAQYHDVLVEDSGGWRLRERRLLFETPGAERSAFFTAPREVRAE